MLLKGACPTYGSTSRHVEPGERSGQPASLTFGAALHLPRRRWLDRRTHSAAYSAPSGEIRAEEGTERRCRQSILSCHLAKGHLADWMWEAVDEKRESNASDWAVVPLCLGQSRGWGCRPGPFATCPSAAAPLPAHRQRSCTSENINRLKDDRSTDKT